MSFWRGLRSIVVMGGLAAGLRGAAPAPTAEAIAKLPAAATRPVDFRRDIQPILESSCVKCHGRGKAKGDWRLDTREDFLRPGESGPVVVPGDGARSRVLHLVAGTDPDSVMPQKGTRLTPEQVGLLRAWVDQGLPWAPGVTFAKPAPNNLQPHHPDLPAGTKPGHPPLDALLSGYLTRNHVPRPRPVDDRVFARRVYLDTIGLLPTPDELEAFLKDRSPDKRARLVRRLLSDPQRYAQHWLSFWNDLLRNDYKGTGYIDGGRKPITAWLYAALKENRPYDQMVRELVNPTDASEGFTKGIVWRGTVNASMTPPMQAAQNIGQVLMGVNLKCASCHDSFIDDWQLSDAYGLAGIYADAPLEMVLCDKPTGKHAPLRFLFPELGAVDARAARSNRLEQLARIITRPENGRLSRTIVNRLWARFLGHGLVEPLDVMQNVAWDPAILDWLAEDLVAHRWDLKRTMEQILTSQAYQMPSVNLTDKPDPQYVFRGPAVRRLTAEQFRDALGSLTGVWHERPEGGIERLLLEPGDVQPLAAQPYWIWSDAHAATAAPPGTNGFRRSFVLAAAPTEATLFLHADNSARVFLNGQPVRGASSGDWQQPTVLDLRAGLRVGTNVLAIEAVNGGDAPNPAGVIAYARIRRTTPAGEQNMDVATDAAWQAGAQPAGNWTVASAGPDWPAASVLGPASLAPWSLGDSLPRLVAGRSLVGRVRASLTTADPLSLALGRPNREQVTTVRPSTATTLQALELTNGETLATLLRKGAARLLTDSPDSRILSERIFHQALSRPPTRTEARLATGLLGRKPTQEGVEDLLWSVAMLPEFQLNY